MKKGLALIAMLMLAVVMLSGCNLIGYNQELDYAQPVATVNGTDITKGEWLAFREYLANYDSQYYQQYYGISMPVTDEVIESYSESALDQMIQTVVMEDKLAELGYDVLSEEEQSEVDTYAESMMDMYEMMMRYQNYAYVETVEEEAARLAAATPSEAEPVQPVATITNAELEAMIASDLAAYGYSVEYFAGTQKASLQDKKLREYVTADVAVTDEEVKAEFDKQVASLKESYDANPTLYASAASSGTAYYIPEGYRGVKHILIGFTDEQKTQITELNNTLTTAQNSAADIQRQLDELNAQDTAEYDEEALMGHQAQIEELTLQLTAANETVANTQAQLDEANAAAFAGIEPKAAEVLAKVQEGGDFDALIAEYGEDSGMTVEPAKTQGYAVCEGLQMYVPEFQDAAMALGAVGDVSGLVKTDYGYHILQYACDIPAGPVEYTDEIKTALHDEMLATAQDAAYTAAVTEWVSAAEVKKFPKVME